MIMNLQLQIDFSKIEVRIGTMKVVNDVKDKNKRVFSGRIVLNKIWRLLDLD